MITNIPVRVMNFKLPNDMRGAVISWIWLTAAVASLVGIPSVAYVSIVAYTGANETKIWFGGAGAIAHIPRPLSLAGRPEWPIFPYDWEKLPWRFEKGQTIEIKARGRVNLDMAGNVSAGELRRDLESRIASRERLNTLAFAAASLPEDRLTADEIRLLSDPRSTGPWTGPGGYEPQTALSKLRASRRALPNAPLGALIGRFHGSDCPNAVAATFLIGESARVEAPCAGNLWMSVNEVVFQPAPWLFREDNGGSYVVSIALVD
jgi:hypothetical protein